MSIDLKKLIDEDLKSVERNEEELQSLSDAISARLNKKTKGTVRKSEPEQTPAEGKIAEPEIIERAEPAIIESSEPVIVEDESTTEIIVNHFEDAAEKKYVPQNDPFSELFRKVSASEEDEDFDLSDAASKVPEAKDEPEFNDEPQDYDLPKINDNPEFSDLPIFKPMSVPEQKKCDNRIVIKKKSHKKYVYPSVDLVKPADFDAKSGDFNDIYSLEDEKLAEKLKNTLKNFGIGITVTKITRGPTVTRFEFKPDDGIKISKIVSLTDDIALSLAASAVRMEAPIPGKSAIGIEIPNTRTDTVYFYDVINSKEYKEASRDYKLSVALGKSIEGKTVVADLAKMPHTLIAGSTGSGKSVCINTIIMGILYGAKPDEVKFIMIDPKVVELGIYNAIPHLLIPVVTEPKKASAALAWAVNEVERRYQLFAKYGVRELKSFNRGIKERPEMQEEEKMPQILIIIDELADLMMAAPQDVEKSIIRLAQKARAAGVHLVIATQRPSVDVITGIIKANIPSRIAFAVASQFDSRTILDTIGAEKLLGRGDMLYHPLGFNKSLRVQGAFVSDGEVERVVQFVKDSYGEPEFDDNVADSIEEAVRSANEKGQKNQNADMSDGPQDDQDIEIIKEAAEIAFSQGGLSTSNLQRRLRLGYNRAARVIDYLEEAGLLSAADGSRPRKLLMTKEEWEAIL